MMTEEIQRRGNVRHDPFDVDRDRDAVHHTLGDKPWQAAKGDHTHSGYQPAGDYLTPDEADLAYAAIGHNHDGTYLKIADDWHVLRKTANQDNNTTTIVDITDLDTGTGLATGLYVYEAYIYFQSAATTTGLQLNLSFPAAEVSGSFNVEVPISATAGVFIKGKATGDKALGTGVAVINTTYLARITGLLRVTAAMSSGIRPRYNSEIAASNVKIMADSVVMYKKVA